MFVIVKLINGTHHYMTARGQWSTDWDDAFRFRNPEIAKSIAISREATVVVDNTVVLGESD